MRFVLALLAVLGIAASGLALREHYRTDTSPCSINEKWDCGIVNHSPCAASLAVISVFSLLVFGTVVSRGRLKNSNHGVH
jgi:hypothetical protein